MYLDLIYNEVKSLIPELHHEFNDSDTIVYPYAVYRVKPSNHPDDGQMNGTLEIEMYDNYGPNKLPMEELFLSVQEHFEKCKMMDSEHIVTTQFSSALTLPSPGETINRKLITLRIKIDRRY